jgi:hypothetical protein
MPMGEKKQLRANWTTDDVVAFAEREIKQWQRLNNVRYWWNDIVTVMSTATGVPFSVAG